MHSQTFNKQREWGMRCCQCHVLCVIATLTFLTTVHTSSSCLETVNSNKENVYNCTGKGLSTLPEALLSKFEVLEFSENKFMVLPHIPESADCSTHICRNKNATDHCRLDVLFSRNQINSLSKDSFHSLRCMRTLDLSFNELKGDTFHVNTFQEGAFNLQRLLLNNNPLGSLPDNVLPQPFIPDLRELDLSHCNLEQIGANSIDDFGELRILNLSFNKLTKLSSELFKGLNKLEHLDLRENELTSFPEHIFGDLVNLKVLLLSDNRIQSFHDNSFYIDSSLQVLNLRNNQLTSIPYTAVDKLANLQSLDLSGNPIQKVTRSTKPSNVLNLTLDNMPELTELGPDALASFPALVYLSLSDNKALTKLHQKFLGDMSASLKHIRFENNKLSSLSSETLPWKQMETIQVSGNPWSCDDKLEWMTRAKGIENDVTCMEPAQLKGHKIKGLNPQDLVRDYSLETATACIILFVCLPVFGICAVLVWRRRRYCPCVKVTVNGQYVTLFTREIDEQGEQRVAIDMKINTNNLNAISNGRADDTKPFIRMKKGGEDEFD